MTKLATSEDTPIQYLSAASPPGFASEKPNGAVLKRRNCIRVRNSRPRDSIDAIVTIDGRTHIGRTLKEFRDELVAHLGNRPNVVHRALIERACQLKLRLMGADLKYGQSGAMSEHDVRTYLAWNNSLVRTLSTIGLEAAPAPTESLSDVIAAIGARKATQAPPQAPSAPPTPIPAPDDPHAAQHVSGASTAPLLGQRP